VVKDAIADLRFSLQKEFQSLHGEMIRQMEVQREEVQRMVERLEEVVVRRGEKEDWGRRRGGGGEAEGSHSSSWPYGANFP